MPSIVAIDRKKVWQLMGSRSASGLEMSEKNEDRLKLNGRKG